MIEYSQNVACLDFTISMIEKYIEIACVSRVCAKLKFELHEMSIRLARQMQYLPKYSFISLKNVRFSNIVKKPNRFNLLQRKQESPSRTRVRDLLELHDLVALAVERGPLLLVGRLARREVLLLLLLARLQPMFFLPPGQNGFSSYSNIFSNFFQLLENNFLINSIISVAKSQEN